MKISIIAKAMLAALLSAGIALTAGTVVTPPLAALVQPLAADTPVWVNLAVSPTAGDAYVSVQFIKPTS